MEAPRSLPGSRHRLARHLAGGLGLCALVAALAVAAPGGAGAATEPGVLVTGPGVTRGFVSGAELSGGPGVETHTYTLRASPGEEGQRVPRTGLPAAALLERAGIAEPQTIGYLTVPRTDGTTAYLPGVDFGPSAPFPDGPAIFSYDRPSIRFLRPVTADLADANAADSVTGAGGESLAIGVHEGNVLGVSASASTSSATAGQPVAFTASSSGALPEEEVTYRWSFGDGATATGAEASHAFAGSGTFQARVTATGSRESGGESGPVAVVVGDPPVTAGEPGAAPPATQPQSPKPTRKPGTGGKNRGAKQGQGGGKEKGRGADEPGDGKKGGDGTTDGGAKQDGAASPGGEAATPESPSPLPETSPLPEASTPEPFPVTPEAPLPEPPGTSEPGATPPTAAPSAPRPAKPGPGAAGSNLETIEGRLVADSLGPIDATEEAAAAAAGAAEGSSAFASRADDDGGGAGVPVAALVVIALIGAGTFWELRGARRWSR